MLRTPQGKAMMPHSLAVLPFFYPSSTCPPHIYHIAHVSVLSITIASAYGVHTVYSFCIVFIPSVGLVRVSLCFVLDSLAMAWI